MATQSIIAQTATNATREATARDAGRSGLFIQRRTRTAAAAHAIVVVGVARHGTDRNRNSVVSTELPNQSTIDAGVAERRTDVVGYGRLNRRSNSTTDTVRCGAVRCGATVQQTRGRKWHDSCAVCTTVYSVYGDSVI